MQKECAIIAIINMEGQRSLGTAHMISCTLQECVKTAISTITTGRKESRKKEIEMSMRRLTLKACNIIKYNNETQKNDYPSSKKPLNLSLLISTRKSNIQFALPLTE